MPSVFDGMGGVLNEVFGAPLTVTFAAGGGLDVHGILRDREVEVAGEDGEPVLTVQPTLRIPAGDVAAQMGEGDIIEQGERRYRVIYRVPAENPAVDRLETFVLRRDAT